MTNFVIRCRAIDGTSYLTGYGYTSLRKDASKFYTDTEAKIRINEERERNRDREPDCKIGKFEILLDEI